MPFGWVFCKKCGAEMDEINTVVHTMDTGHSRFVRERTNA